MNVFEKISAQQAGKEESPVFYVGEQLKDICRADKRCAEIIERDLDIPEMSLVHAEKQIKKAADAKRQNSRASSICVSPSEADKILREFYSLPGAGMAEKQKQSAPLGEIISLEDFL